MNTSEAQRRYLHTNLANIDRMTREELIQLLETIPGVVPVFLESQEEYEEIATKDPKTFYIIEEESGTDISYTIYLGEELIYSSGVPSEQEIFIAEYGVTPVTDIATAYHTGKVVYCKLLKANYPAGYDDSAPADAYALVPLVACYFPTIPALWFSTGADSIGRVLVITHTGGWSVRLDTLRYYTKPSTGIPESDLSQSVKNGLASFVNANMSYEEVGIAYNKYGRHLLYEDVWDFGHGSQEIFLLLTNHTIDIVEELEAHTYCFSGICRDLKDTNLKEYFVTKKLDINGWETLNVSPVDAITPQRFYIETGKYLAIACDPGGGKILGVTVSPGDDTQSNFKILIGDNSASAYCQNTPEVDFYYGDKADWSATHLLLASTGVHVDIISLGIDQTSIELIDTSDVDDVYEFDDLHIAYEKPSTGIPESDLSQSIQVSTFINDAGYLTQHQDISGKADKVSGGTADNFAAIDQNGNLKDSGHKHSDYLTSHQDISGKADKVSGATNNNFAKLDAYGNLGDSGKKASDFQPTLISGTTIKTINNQSLLGSGNINIGSGTSSALIVEYDPMESASQTLSDIHNALSDNQLVYCRFIGNYIPGTGSVNYYIGNPNAAIGINISLPLIAEDMFNYAIFAKTIIATYPSGSDYKEALIEIRVEIEGGGSQTWNIYATKILDIN